MQTYLFTWNPRRWRWTDFDLLISEIERAGHVLNRWGCGSSKQISPGDKFLLMRLGVHPRGIIGGGMIDSKPYRHRHWKPKEAMIGRSALYVDIVFEWLTPVPAIPLETLETPEFQPFNWTPRASGTRIPENLAFRIPNLASRAKTKGRSRTGTAL